MNNKLLEYISASRRISLEEAAEIVNGMSFKEYHTVLEASADLTPPSGNKISPTSPGNATSNIKPSTTSTSMSGAKSIWPGGEAPVEVGMTVGLKDQNGLPVPGQVSQIDSNAKGAKIKNSTTNQEEWYNLDNLDTIMQDNQQAGISETRFKNTFNKGDTVDTPIGPGEIVSVSPDVDVNDEVQVRLHDPSAAGPDGEFKDTFTFTTSMLKHVDMQFNEDIARIKELAGIRENCSAGATSAGSIAVSPSAGMSPIKKRNPTDEALKKEYTPTQPAKTIVGDTKPSQASGELSATLAANGKKTASRNNNGFKK